MYYETMACITAAIKKSSKRGRSEEDEQRGEGERERVGWSVFDENKRRRCWERNEVDRKNERGAYRWTKQLCRV